MPDYYFPEVNTSGQFTDPKVITNIETLAKNALVTALAAKRGVEPTELGTEHLDTVVVPDVYSQSSNLESTLESGYPTTRAGILIVERSASKTMVWQTYTPYTPTITTPQQSFSRSYYQGNWTPWVSSQTMAWESYALFTEDLNTLVEPRIYSQASNSRATIETNYPVTWAGILEVTANNSRYIVRQVYRPYANSRVAIGETWTRSMYNGTWSSWERSDGRAILPEGGTTNQVLTAGTNGNLQWGPVISSSASTLTGPGRPDQSATTGGVITGNEPVGTEYRSTDGAGVGAFVWMKRPGGKWEVTDGDTGWRLLTDPAAIPVVIYARRLNSTVEVRGYIASHGGTVPRIAGTSYYVEQGLGFRPNKLAAPGHRNMGGIGATFADRTNMDHANPIAIMVVGTETGHDIYWGRITITDRRATGMGEATINYTTSEPWPSAPLPGTPA